MEKLNCKGKLVTKQEKKKEIEVMSKQMKPNTQVNKKKGASGITLVALVITIIILIILATITINFAFGEGGLIQKAQQAKNLTEQAVQEEQEKLNSLMDEYDKIINGIDGAEEEPEEEQPPEYTDIYVTMYTDGTLAFASTADAKLSGKEVKTEYGNVADISYIPWSSERDNITNVIFIDEIVPSDTGHWFYNCGSLKSIENIENLAEQQSFLNMKMR